MSKIQNLTDQREKLQAILRQIRIETGLRQVDLARCLEVPQSFVSKYESGERKLDILELRMICGAMGIAFEDFITRLEEVLNES